ncbi:MAG: hypothetical protein M3Z02_06445 [Actinomycetota bacterium]|nr:hypothetical protein [Actinomycetota bacterium]
MAVRNLDPVMLGAVVRDIDGWRERMISTPAEVHVGSELYGDDESTGFLQISHAVQNSLNAATDHLHCLRTLIVDAEWLHTNAPFTLARAALECAATAVWLLAPADPRERITRRLQLANADRYDWKSVIEAVGGDVSGLKAVGDEIRRIAGEQLITSSVKGEHAKFERIVTGAGVHLGDGPRYRRIWKGASGYAHGRMWATVQLSDVLVLSQPAIDVRQIQVTVNPDRFMSALGHAHLMTREAWKLYDVRREPPLAPVARLLGCRGSS